MSETASPFNSDHYRKVMGRLPTGVVAITGLADDGNELGLIVGTFHSLSMNPPVVTFSVASTSQTWPLIRRRKVFTANVLSSTQTEVCRSLAKKGPGKFENVDRHPGPVGTPRLADAIAWIDCTVQAEILVGDHFMVVGNVEAMESSDGVPLLFQAGQFGSYEPLESATAKTGA